MAIEENIRSLESIIKLLVPDLFESEACRSIPSGEIDPREHGFLTQGRISVTFSVDFVNRDEGSLSDDPLPQLQIKLDDDIKLFRDSGQEFVDLALRCHRGILSEYFELANMFDANPKFVTMFEDDKAEVGSHITRLNTALRRFSALIFYDETTEVESALQAGRDDARGTERPVSLELNREVKEEEEEDDEDSDFIEVPSIHPSTPPTACTQSRKDLDADNSPAEPFALLTDLLPWETDAKSTSSFSWKTQKPNLEARAKPLGVTKRRLKPTHEKPVESIILPYREARRMKVDESSHRFWKPYDVTEFERPETDLVEAAISMTATSFRPPAEICVVYESPTDETNLAGENSVSLPDQTPPLACWVPLPSGRLCPRRDPSGRCHIHGRIVPRHRVTGKPIRQADALRLEAEAIARMKAEVQANKAIERKRRRRRYPELEDIASTEKSTARLLRHRLLGPKSLRKLGDTLDEADRIEAKRSFTDNFHHTFRR